MRINIENALAQMPAGEGNRFVLKELIRHLKELRDRTDAGDLGAVGEFFELYRFSDNQLGDRVAPVHEVAGVDPGKTWPVVMRFAVAMEGKLAQNRHKGDRAGWLAMDCGELRDRLRDEVDELDDAIRNLSGPKAILAEAADVANFAMMIADREGVL